MQVKLQKECITRNIQIQASRLLKNSRLGKKMVQTRIELVLCKPQYNQSENNIEINNNSIYIVEFFTQNSLNCGLKLILHGAWLKLVI